MLQNMTNKQKKMLARIFAAAVLLIVLHFVPARGLVKFGLYLVPYLIIGCDILKKAWKGIINRQPFDECLLMTIATIGAFAIAVCGTGDYVEAVAVMLFYQIGELFQSYAVGRSRRNISELMDIRPDYANVEEDGTLVQVDPDEVEIGTVIIVQPGEKVPIDGVITAGSCMVDTSALTGESIPARIQEGDEIISGSIVTDGVVSIRTTKEFGESTASQILDLVENASSRKSRSENFITRFARVYTPAVVFSSLALALLPPLVRILFLHQSADWSTWVYRALTFLVISCPCALVISIPLSFFAGLGGAGREGILIKGSNFLERLSQVRCVLFDKTGTLTRGVFEVTGIHHSDLDREELLRLAAHAECASSHPISKSIQTAYGKEIRRDLVEDIREISGNGVTAVVEGKQIAVGNEKLMDRMEIDCKPCHEVGTVIHIGVDEEYKGHLVISDVLKEGSREALNSLKAAGVRRTVLLSGDAEPITRRIAGELGIDEAYGSLLPADKVALTEKYLAERPSGEAVAFVGDGINDAPVLSRADIGIAMGALGSDAAIEAADVVLMDDDPRKIAKAIRIARKCMRIVHENIIFAIGIKLLCLVLGAFGMATMWTAIFADVGVMILAVLNAIRALFVHNL